MRKPAQLPLKILLFLLCGGILAVWIFLDLPCIPRYFTGIICPACGMSRAWLAALRLDLSAAFFYHPLFWSVPLFGLYILYDGEFFRNRRLNYWVLGILLAAFLVCYCIRLIVFLDGQLFI